MIATRDRIQELEEEITTEIELVEKSSSKDRSKHEALLKEAYKNLSDEKSKLSELEMEKQKIVDLMVACENDAKIDKDVEIPPPDSGIKEGKSKKKK